MYISPKKRSSLNTPVVVEIGTLNAYAGLAGYDQPQVMMPSEVAFDEQKNDYKQLDWFMPRAPEGYEVRKILKNGQFQDLEALKYVLLDITERQLHLKPQETPIFLVEPPFLNREQRLKIVEMIFDDCGFDGFFLHKGPVLSSYIFARDSVILLDSGADGTYFVPIQEGFINYKALMRTQIGGEYLTSKLLEIFNQRQGIKAYFSNFDQCTQSMKLFGQMEIVREIKHKHCKLLDYRSNHDGKFKEVSDSQLVELPDKSQIELSSEIFQVPELLFSQIPECNFFGLANLVKQAIEKVDMDARKDLIQNIMVVGANSLLPQFVERMQKEIQEVDMYGLQQRVKTFTPPNIKERQYSSWLGGSIVASMANFDQIQMSKRDYEEHGSILIERKMFQQ